MKKLFLVIALCSYSFLQINAQTTDNDKRMEWWREARFGMFIHWGVYSVPAGTYKGQQINRLGEWIMNRGKIPVAD
ncbi:MAG: alpha-L-fucosidase, partial [Chitinophagaceae bacterium]